MVMGGWGDMYTGKKYMCTLPVTLLFGISTKEEKLLKKSVNT